MAPESLITVMTVAVVLSAIAMVAQAVAIFAIYRGMKQLKAEVAVFLPKAEHFMATTEKRLKESQAELTEVTSRAKLVLENTQKQVARVDSVLEDASSRAKAQMERLELVIDDTVGRVHKTVVQLNESVARPVREVNAVATGLRAAVASFLRGGRPSVAQATSDEEMFI